MQTPEDRIVAEFKARKKRHDWSYGGLNSIYMSLARKHKRPIAVLKALVDQSKRKEQGNA